MLKIKEIYGHVTQGQKNVEPFLARADYPRFKRQSGVKKVKFAGKASSVDQEAIKKFFLNTC